MSAVYREARRGKIDIKDLNGFINALAAIGRLIESSDLEKRLDELERRSTYGEI
ncbi:MAG: hypothetical protein HZC44_07955 [Geobacter sp.]|nr:hypothetical protein [Geobacter sp.]